MSFVFGLWAASAAQAQVDEWPCKGDPGLLAAIEGSALSLDYEQGKDLVFTAASSVLAPPASKEPKEESDDPADLVEQHGLWTCTYGAPHLIDGDEHTAWAEGAKGTGVGSVVVVPLPAGSGPMEIRGGFGKSPELYQANGRPRKVEVLLLGQGVSVFGAQYDAWRAIPLLGRGEVELKDVDGWQPLTLPAAGPPPATWKPGGPPGTVANPADQHPAYVAIRILSVYPGTRYEDTCISEIRRR